MLGATPLLYRPSVVPSRGDTQSLLESISIALQRAWNALLGRVPIVGGPAEAARYAKTLPQGYGLPWYAPHGFAENILFQEDEGEFDSGSFWHPSRRAGEVERQGVGEFNIFGAAPWLMVGSVVLLGGFLIYLWKGQGDITLRRNPTRGTPRKVTRYYYETLPYAKKRFRSQRRAKEYAARVAWTRYKKYGKRKRRSR